MEKEKLLKNVRHEWRISGKLNVTKDVISWSSIRSRRKWPHSVHNWCSRHGKTGLMTNHSDSLFLRYHTNRLFSRFFSRGVSNEYFVKRNDWKSICLRERRISFSLSKCTENPDEILPWIEAITNVKFVTQRFRRHEILYVSCKLIF